METSTFVNKSKVTSEERISLLVNDAVPDPGKSENKLETPLKFERAIPKKLTTYSGKLR